MKPYRLAVLNSHVIQYFAPLYRRLSQEPDIDLTVYYCRAIGRNSGTPRIAPYDKAPPVLKSVNPITIPCQRIDFSDFSW